MKVFALTAVLMSISACDAPAQSVANPNAERLDCAVGAGRGFASDCRVERSVRGSETQLVVRHPDGSFRRFTVQQDGSGVAVADGADRAVQRLDGATLEVEVAGDRYRFPARQIASNAASE